ncbi:hypothetical protein F4604DRAFT_1973925 [Suillus subluteus]|nr:hypothetical protein F4604DRAFT_1973925 [Suillus subluteus]
MSSCRNSAAEEQALMSCGLKFGKSKDCVRCRLKSGNIMIRHVVYCKEFFTPIVDMKCRKALKPSLKASGNLCLDFSGGLGSSITLDINHNTCFSGQPPLDDSGKPRGGTNHARNASIWPSCIVCYVEACRAFAGWIKVSRSNTTPHVWLELTNEDLITDEAMWLYLSSLSTQTAISSALQNLTHVLILHMAHSRGSSHLLFGSSLMLLSISLLSSISQVIRPLRDITAKECAVYVWWNKSVIGRDKQRCAILGMAALTKNFVVRLEKDYPSTVSTITQICEKLEPKDAASGQCRLYDKLAADLARILLPCRGNLDTSIPSQMLPLLALTNFFCYSCHTRLTSRSSLSVKQSAPGVSSATHLPI